MLEQLKIQFKSIIDLSILKQKFCKWAKNGQLLTGLRALVDRMINTKMINKYPSKVNALKEVNKVLTKLLSTVTVVKSIQTIISIIPGIPADVTDTISKITDIDNNMLIMFNKIGFNC